MHKSFKEDIGITFISSDWAVNDRSNFNEKVNQYITNKISKYSLIIYNPHAKL